MTALRAQPHDPRRPTGRVHFPKVVQGSGANLLVRLGIAVSLILFVTAVAWLGRAGYRDVDESPVGLLDAVYYASVSVTTTGYGDITPISETARVLNVVFITPARVLFLVILVGTTLEVLATRAGARALERRWSSKVHDHVIVCGYGIKGRAAVHSLIAQGFEGDRIAVIDSDEHAVERANHAGLTAIRGDATESGVLRRAGVERARAVIVCASRDETAALINLTIRSIAAEVPIACSVREEENAELLRQSGATTTVVPSIGAGRLLSQSLVSPAVTDVLEDLVSDGEGLELVDEEVTAADVGGHCRDVDRGQVIAIVRGPERFAYDDPRAAELQAGDRIVRVARRSTG